MGRFPCRPGEKRQALTASSAALSNPGSPDEPATLTSETPPSSSTVAMTATTPLVPWAKASRGYSGGGQEMGIGAVIGAALFIATWAALTFFYIPQPPESHYRFFTTGIWFSLPWLIVNGGFAGYTAYAMTKKV